MPVSRTAAQAKATSVRPAAGRPRGRGDATQKAIRDAAIAMFSELGYHAVTLRSLADRIGIQAGSLYNHIENKQELLFEILHEIMSDLVRSFEEKVAPVKGAQPRLDAFIANHVAFHTARQQEVFIGNMELRNLSPENRDKLIALRDRYQAHLLAILREGRTIGAFAIQDERMVAYAIFGMLNGVANWFDAKGRRSAADIAAEYTKLIHAMVSDRA